MFTNKPIDVDEYGFPDPLPLFYNETTRRQFQMDRLRNDNEQQNIEGHIGNLNLNLTPTHEYFPGSQTIKDVFNLMTPDSTISRGKLTLVVFLFQHGSVCQLDKPGAFNTPILLDNALQFIPGKVLVDEDGMYSDKIEGTAVVDAVQDEVVLENLWVANFASPGATTSFPAKEMQETLENINSDDGSKCQKLKEFLEKGFDYRGWYGGPPISQLYKLIDKGKHNATGCFDFSVGYHRTESKKMGLTKVVCGSQSLGTGERKNHFLEKQEGYTAVDAELKNDVGLVMFSDLVKQVIKEVGETNEFEDVGIGDGFDETRDKYTLGITNILFINATCQSMVSDDNMQIRSNVKTVGLREHQINPILENRNFNTPGHWNDYLEQLSLDPELGGGGKTRRRIKKRKDIRKRKKKIKNGRRKTRRKKRKNKKKRKQRKKNTRKKRGGGCENRMGTFGDYLPRDYHRCMNKMRNKNNKTSKTYCCAAAIRSREAFRKREKQREINRDVKQWEEEEKGDLRDQRIREQRRITNFHRQQSEEEAQTKRSMRLWDEWEEKEKKKFYDSFKEERKSLLKKLFNRLNTQQQTILKQEGVAGQIKIIVKQTKEFINQMNEYVATKLGGWSQGIQQQKNRWETEQQQLFVKQQQQVKQQGINLKDPQSTVNGLNQQLEFLFNQLYNGIDEDILKDYAFAKAREEDIKIIKRQLQVSGQNYIPAPGNTLIQQSINLRRMYPTFTQNLNMAFNNYPPSDDDDLSAFVAFNSIYPINNNQSMRGGKRKTRRKKRKTRKN